MSEYVVRRDPRIEWILRNRLHPEHSSLSVQPIEEIGPSGVKRLYPHRVGFIGPNGIKRIDRVNSSNTVSMGSRSTGMSKTEELPLYKVDKPDYYVLVVPDMVGGRLSSHDKDIIGQARQLIAQSEGVGAVALVVFGESKEEHFDTSGADRIIQIHGDVFEGYAPEQKANVLKSVDLQLSAKYWLFPDSIQGGFEVGARFAALVNERPATQVWQANSETVVSRGSAGKTDIERETPRVLLLAAECALPIDETRHEASLMELPVLFESISRVTDLGNVAVDPQAVPLTEAEFILSAGNGVDDWNLYHQAAEVLGATEGASRVAVDDGHMPRHRQVGATGSWVTARVYIALGISGAIQHLQGIGSCEKVVAVNTDAGCDMVKRADLSVIVDSNEFLAALVKLVEQYQAEEHRDAA